MANRTLLATSDMQSNTKPSETIAIRKNKFWRDKPITELISCHISIQRWQNSQMRFSDSNLFGERVCVRRGCFTGIEAGKTGIKLSQLSAGKAFISLQCVVLAWRSPKCPCYTQHIIHYELIMVLRVKQAWGPSWARGLTTTLTPYSVTQEAKAL